MSKDALWKGIVQLQREMGKPEMPRSQAQELDENDLERYYRELQDMQVYIERGTPSFHWHVGHATKCGYGVANYGYLKALEKVDAMPSLSFKFDKYLDMVQYENNPRTKIINVDYAMPTWWTLQGRYKIGYTVYEPTLLPPHWVPTMNKVDEIWTPSKHAATIFENSGVETEPWVIQHCINPEYWTQEGIVDRGLAPDDHYVFYGVGDLNGRKGWDIYLSAYLEEFSRDDKVTAVFKAYDDAVRVNQAMRRLTEKPPEEQPRVLIITGWADDVRPRIRRSDCVVMASRAEGFGLPGLEALQMGKQLITTNWGGQLEYATDKNSWLIDCELVPIHSMEKFVDWNMLSRIGAEFAEPSIDHLKELMRSCYENKKECARKRKQAKQDVKQFYDVSIGERIKNRVNEIWEEQI